MEDSLGRKVKKEKIKHGKYSLKIFQTFHHGCWLSSISIEDEHENLWTFVSYSKRVINQPESYRNHVVALGFKTGDRPFKYDLSFGRHLESEDIDSIIVDGLKLLDLKSPLREALRQFKPEITSCKTWK